MINISASINCFKKVLLPWFIKYDFRSPEKFNDFHLLASLLDLEKYY